ncbi:MAG: hypothetical protein ACI9CA_001324 [Natronomonas sp.]|jgi:hypothetical protein
MPSVTRRRLLGLAGAGTTVALAGCGLLAGGEDFPTAGSLGFANLDNLPHTLGVRVVDAPETYRVDGRERGVPLSQRRLRASVTLRPDETLLYPSVFTESVSYEVEITADGGPPRRADAEAVTFNPQLRGDGQYLSVETGESGETAWVVTAAGTSDHYDGPADTG